MWATPSLWTPFNDPLMAPLSRARSATEAPLLPAAPRPTCLGWASPSVCRPADLGCAAQDTPQVRAAAGKTISWQLQKWKCIGTVHERQKKVKITRGVPSASVPPFWTSAPVVQEAWGPRDATIHLMHSTVASNSPDPLPIGGCNPEDERSRVTAGPLLMRSPGSA